MTAQQTRNMHIAKVNAELVRLTSAVKELESNTAALPYWNFVGDWQHIAQEMNEITDYSESLARQSRYEAK